MKNKKSLNKIKKMSTFILMLMILYVSPQYSRCSEPEYSSKTETHFFISPRQNDI